MGSLVTVLLTNPEVLHAAFALGGFALAWYMKRHPLDKLDPEILDALRKLIERRKAQAAEAAVADLTKDVK